MSLFLLKTYPSVPRSPFPTSARSLMSLIFANGESFATGALQYSYGPATAGETTNRIIMPVEIEGVSTNAVVDTGAPYVKIGRASCRERV